MGLGGMFAVFGGLSAVFTCVVGVLVDETHGKTYTQYINNKQESDIEKTQEHGTSRVAKSRDPGI